MNENIKIMLEKLTKDEETLKKLSAVRDPDEAYAIVSAIQGGYTQEEFVEAMKSLNEQIDQDLSENDLATASGGDDSEIINKLITAPGDSGVTGETLAPSSLGVLAAAGF